MRVQCALAFLAAMVAAGPVSAASCLPRSVAPGQFPNPRGGGDVGIVATTFLDLKGPQGVYKVAHGVDLSDNNRPNYDQLKFCGTDFAIIKLYPTRPGFNEDQIRELNQRNIEIVPYYYLEMPGKYKHFPELFDSDADLDQYIAEAQAVGQADATAFLQTYHRLFGANHAVNIGGLGGDVLALDVEEAFDTSSLAATKARGGYPPLGASSITLDEYDRYGQTYSAMVASWVKTVQAGLPGVTILFYTYPSMYMTYLLPARLADYNVFHGLPIWLAEPTRHGGDLTDADAAVTKGARQLCFSTSGGNKCVIHQYTARGVFGVVQPSAKTLTQHVDLNRFFSVDQIVDGVNRQYVRKVDYVTAPEPAPAKVTPPAPAGVTPPAVAAAPPTPVAVAPPPQPAPAAPAVVVAPAAGSPTTP